ncbi:alpha/beta hydrolase family protein [Vibrio sp. LaRot3]|uniref:alpha/beta hydrolase family protein n=1 Tax=Vibrio sp. LaRot3 TaxID=2998829 RepID=UPI0022CE034C|nr:prolyl oligopeptidase family serine peptidase [Vibrio sp. LaRot3]MDA0149644.1 prolyl oligopeptidase family serine peptidase [Vibrio sp. LaRot3]
MLDEQQALQAIKNIAGSVKPIRAPILKTPADYGLEYQNVFFQAMDGVPLEGWFIPADSNKLIIFNHPGTFNRYGFPGHLEPWSNFSDVEVDLVKIQAELHKAGYNVLAYDMRNHGHSGDAHGGAVGLGFYEWRDVIGAMQYAQTQPHLKQMQVGLFSPCAGGNATMVAMSKHPEFFTDVKALVCPQPCSAGVPAQIFANMAGVGDRMDEIDLEQRKLGGLPNSEMTPHPYAVNVHTPTFIIQVRDDAWTKPDDVQTTFDLLGTKEKKLFWVEGTTQRFDGYNYFGDNPEQMIEFFNQYMQ